MELNDKQKQVVTNINGPFLVLAGAGSGKTKAITSKIIHMVNNGIPANNILAVTFTNKAAKEMRYRVVPFIKGNVNIYTFHSLCVRILQDNLENFTIFDQSDSRAIIKKIIKKHMLDMKYYHLINYIEKIKNNGINHDIYNEKYHKYYLEYENELKKSSAIDFGGLIVKVLELFKDKKILKKYQEKYKYILVDEYQDTNKAQFDLMNLLAVHKNICVVGDIDQSIYSFRNADVRNILKFEEIYNARTILLEQNYRSTQTIVNAASELIKHNKYRKDKNLWTENELGSKIKILRCESDREEARFIISRLPKNLEDTVILYRNNYQSRLFEEELNKRNIPYNIFGGMKFYDRKEIKDLISYLRLVNNHNDNQAFLRIVNYPTRGIGKKSLEQIINYSEKNNISYFEGIQRIDKIKNKLSDFISLIKEAKKLSLNSVLPFIIEKTNYINNLTDNYMDLSKKDNIKELQKSILDYEGAQLKDFLNSTSLSSESEDVLPTITLMTIHAAKGLEFKNVFIVGLEESIFPSSHALEKDEIIGIEEERRLMYVAMTRAKKNLVLSFSTSRHQYGYSEQNLPSRFLREIPREYIELIVL